MTDLDIVKDESGLTTKYVVMLRDNSGESRLAICETAEKALQRQTFFRKELAQGYLLSPDASVHGVPKCDHCEKPATMNYQTGYARYDIVNGKYTLEDFDADDQVNDHLCDEHDTEEHRN